jgi:alpha-L-fucosidase
MHAMKQFAAVTTLALGISSAAETPAERDQRMAWWREAKFGVFIHWGVYAVPAGIHNGKTIPGIGEWIMHRDRIPVAEYRAFAKDFTASKYNPEAWAELIQAAGARYMVITSKHHDGFALYPSAVTDWDVADASPAGRDLLAPLAAAVRQRGVKFGLYYSQAQDWVHPGGAKADMKEGESWDSAQNGSFDFYLRDIAAPQVREILSRYQPDILWWDTPAWMTHDRARPLADLVSLSPGIITNNRLGGDFQGDTETPEQFVPATGFPGRDWEACMTMNDTWGFKRDDKNWKSTEELIRTLVDCVSKGGNFLLNLGPTPEGEIPAPSIERMKAVGAWMRTNGTAIYGTTASPFHKLDWGRCTKRLNADGGTLFLHVFEWPANGQLDVPGFRSKVAGARMIDGGVTLDCAVTDAGLRISLPAKRPDPAASVIALDFTGPLVVNQILPGPLADGRIELPAAIADIHNHVLAQARIDGRGDKARVTAWTLPKITVSWDFEAKGPGRFQVIASHSGPATAAKASLELGKTQRVIEFPATPAGKRATTDLGVVEITEAGTCNIHLKPDETNWQPLDLFGLTLKPAP